MRANKLVDLGDGDGKNIPLSRWLKILVSGKPHFIIGDPSRPYLLRWWILPRNRYFNLFLHKFLRDDDDRALHDHPWWFISIVLWGGYREITETWSSVSRYTGKNRWAGSVAFRKATHKHRVVLLKNPTWTLILTGPRIRTWGFWCPKGFIPWQEFSKSENPGEVGKGCGD